MEKKTHHVERGCLIPKGARGYKINDRGGAFFFPARVRIFMLSGNLHKLPPRAFFFILTSPITDEREQQNNPAGTLDGSCFSVRNSRKLSTNAAKAITASVARRFFLIFGMLSLYFQGKRSAEPGAIYS